jgi:murein DD-endopeptidase MepM/ murein hydrolase activator NlpD
MISKILLWSTFPIILFFGYYLLPNEWITIYSQMFTSKTPQNILLPVKTININNVENTFGAERPGGRKHEGLDIFALLFTPIISATDGIILYTGRDILGGNVIRILGNDNRIYYYAHLSKYLDFKGGDTIMQGQTIGYVGNSGNAISTPSHLHFEIMEIEWLLPLVTKSINPYFELFDTNKVNYN